VHGIVLDPNPGTAPVSSLLWSWHPTFLPFYYYCVSWRENDIPL